MFLPSFADGHAGCFHLWIIVNSAVTNIHIRVFGFLMSPPVLSKLFRCPPVGIFMLRFPHLGPQLPSPA